MSFTYDPLLVSDADRVRFLIGDTNESDPLLSDEEIGAMVSMESSVDAAAARAAETLVIICGRKAEEVTDDIGQRVKYGDRAGMYRTLAARLRTRVAGTSAPRTSVNVANRAVW